MDVVRYSTMLMKNAIVSTVSVCVCGFMGLWLVSCGKEISKSKP